MLQLKRIFILLIFILLFAEKCFCQPYLVKYDHDKSIPIKGNTSSRYIKINLPDGARDTVYYHNNLLTDNLQDWIIEGENSDYNVMSLSNNNIKIHIKFDPLYAVFSKKHNTLYFIGEDKNGELFSVLDAVTGKIEKTFPLKTYIKYGQMFLSDNEKILYVPFYDNVPASIKINEIKLGYFSTSTNQFIKSISLSEIGIPGADRYFLVNGKNGKGIIESKFDNGDNYYSIYDFDNGSNSPIIFFHGNANAYFTNKGKYLILAEKTDSLTNGIMIAEYTGSIIIYDVSEQILIQTLELPANGEILNYDTSPDILYYYNNKTGEIKAMNIQSIATPSFK